MIGRSLGEPEAFGLIYDRHAATLLRFLGRRVADVDAHYERAVAAEARIADGLRDQFWGERSYEALDLEGHRWTFRQRMREVPMSERWRPGEA